MLLGIGNSRPGKTLSFTIYCIVVYLEGSYHLGISLNNLSIQLSMVRTYILLLYNYILFTIGCYALCLDTGTISKLTLPAIDERLHRIKYIFT